MFNSKDYRAKAAEHQNRARGSHNADEISEYRTLERTFSELADNAAWMEENLEQRIHPVTQEVTAVEEEPPSSENDDSAGYENRQTLRVETVVRPSGSHSCKGRAIIAE